MKVLKNISLFIIYPVTFIMIGFLVGITGMRYFYPGSFISTEEEMLPQSETYDMTGAESVEYTEENVDISEEENEAEPEEDKEAAAMPQRLNAGTSYVLEETDLRTDTVVETTWKLPSMYIGMDREQFVEAMEIYEASPPLDQLQRGFVSLEVLSFSPQKVVVQMNYEYAEPVKSYYLKVENNYVSVYLDDMITLYMDTDICLKDLPEELQQEIIGMMYVPDEESLFGFLENYSS